jgi:hypothetical protein
MAWLEIIDIRSAADKSLQLKTELPKLIDSLQQEYKGDNIKIYRHLTLETDFSIHIYHNGTPAIHHIHPTSQRLISFLKEYGLVSHSFWVEQFE